MTLNLFGIEQTCALKLTKQRPTILYLDVSLWAAFSNSSQILFFQVAEIISLKYKLAHTPFRVRTAVLLEMTSNFQSCFLLFDFLKKKNNNWFSLNISGKLGLAAVSGGNVLRDSQGPPVSKLIEYIKINHWNVFCLIGNDLIKICEFLLRLVPCVVADWDLCLYSQGRGFNPVVILQRLNSDQCHLFKMLPLSFSCLIILWCHRRISSSFLI